MSVLTKKLYENPKRYFSISEVANMFEVSQSLLRFWETEFPLLKPSKNRKGDRLYTEKNVDQLRIIFHLVKEKGFTLEGARNEMSNSKSKDGDKLKVIHELEKIKANLQDISIRLTKLS